MDATVLLKYAQVAQIIQAIFSIVIGVATVRVLFLTFKLTTASHELTVASHALTRQSMVANILGEFNARFSRIWEMRADPHVKADPIVYYQHFWSLQFDQFDAWRRGTVPDDIFLYWANSRHVDWAKDNPLGKMGYKEGFQKTVIATWEQPDFKEFMNILHADGAKVAIAKFPHQRT